MSKKGLKTVKISKEYEAAAKEIILEGFLERFGFIDHSLNPDLNKTTETYSRDGSLFLVGLVGEELVSTGALSNEGGGACRLQRMSVKKDFRHNGLAKMMVEKLENHARSEGYTKIILETNAAWESAVGLYKSCGYREYLQAEGMIHLYKLI